MDLSSVECYFEAPQFPAYPLFPCAARMHCRHFKASSLAANLDSRQNHYASYAGVLRSKAKLHLWCQLDTSTGCPKYSGTSLMSPQVEQTANEPFPVYSYHSALVRAACLALKQIQ